MRLRRVRKNPRNIYISMLRCPKCNNRFPIPRNASKKKEPDHVKHIWCPFCKEQLPFLEKRECETTMV